MAILQARIIEYCCESQRHLSHTLAIELTSWPPRTDEKLDVALIRDDFRARLKTPDVPELESW